VGWRREVSSLKVLVCWKCWWRCVHCTDERMHTHIRVGSNDADSSAVRESVECINARGNAITRTSDVACQHSTWPAVIGRWIKQRCKQSSAPNKYGYDRVSARNGREQQHA
jgi:hypothetical protein